MASLRRILLARPLTGALLQAPSVPSLGRIGGAQLMNLPMRTFATKSAGKKESASRGRSRSTSRKRRTASKSASPRRSRSASAGRGSRKRSGSRRRSAEATARRKEAAAEKAQARRERKQAARERKLAREEEKKEAKRERLAERRARRDEKEEEDKARRAMRRAEKTARNQEKRAIAKEKERIRKAKEKERAKGRRREPGSPPMPRNAQALYVQANFQTAPGATAPERMKHLVAQFKALSPEARKQWDTQAAEDKQRYEKEFAAWRAEHPEKPKRPMTSYLRFASDARASLGLTNIPKGRDGIIAVGKALGEKWRSLSDAEKIKYAEQSAADHEKYKAAMAEWQRKTGSTA